MNDERETESLVLERERTNEKKEFLFHFWVLDSIKRTVWT